MEHAFNPLPSHEGRPAGKNGLAVARGFQSTSLSRGKTQAIWGNINAANLSIHFPLTREDQSVLSGGFFSLPFNPLPSHEGRPGRNQEVGKRKLLSIHFPLTREDPDPFHDHHRLPSFNPLPSHEGRPSRSSNWTEFRSFNPLPSHEGRPPPLGRAARP